MKTAIFLLLSVLVMGLGADAPSTNSRSVFADVALLAPIEFDPADPAVGELVSAEFTIRNTGSSTLHLDNLLVSTRLPGCTNLACADVQDFTAITDIALAPNATYTYVGHTTFWQQGTHLATVAHLESGGAWAFLGDLLEFDVGAGLKVTQSIDLSPSTPEQDELVFVSAEITNNGPRTLNYSSLLVLGRHSAECPPADPWNCPNADWPFTETVTIGAGETVAYSEWRTFEATGDHYAQIAVIDMPGVRHNIGNAHQFAVESPTFTPRTSSWQRGAHYHPTWDERDADRLGMARSVGVDIVRIAVAWQLLEPDGKNAWDDEWYIPNLTNMLAYAADLDLGVYFVVLETPCWASSDPAKDCARLLWNPSYPPINNADYADALTKLHTLFGEQVAAWEIWNEPNIPRFWLPQPDVDEYVALLQTAHSAIKAQDPNATVIAGSIAGTQIAWLEALYAANYDDYADALSIHPYTVDNRAPDDCTQLTAAFQCGVPAMRAMMLHHGDNNPIWLTEFGWSSFNGAGGVGSELQEQYLRESVAMVEFWDYVPVASWYNLIDTTGSPPAIEFEDHMGLFDINLNAKPAAAWLRQEAYSEAVYMPFIVR